MPTVAMVPLEPFEVTDDGGVLVAWGAVPARGGRMTAPRLRLSGSAGDWRPRAAAVAAGRRAMAFDVTAAECRTVCAAVDDLRRTGLDCMLRLDAEGVGRAALAAPDRVDRCADPTRMAAEWRTWLDAAGVLSAEDDDALDAVVVDLSLRRPRYSDWLDVLMAPATSREPTADVGLAVAQGALLGDGSAVRAARLLASRTGDARYWTPAVPGAA